AAGISSKATIARTTRTVQTVGMARSKALSVLVAVCFLFCVSCKKDLFSQSSGNRAPFVSTSSNALRSSNEGNHKNLFTQNELSESQKLIRKERHSLKIATVHSGSSTPVVDGDFKNTTSSDQGTESNNEGETSIGDGVYNMSVAISLGAQFQYKYCGWFCNGTRKQRHDSSPRCSYSPACEVCRCDEACRVYEDCCPDVTGTPLPRSRFRRYAHFRARVQGRRGYHQKSAQMIADCSEDFQGNRQVLENCHQCDNASPRPVASKNTFAVYCNEHCAACNGEHNVIQLNPWRCPSSLGTGNSSGVLGDADNMLQENQPQILTTRVSCCIRHPAKDECSQDTDTNSYVGGFDVPRIISPFLRFPNDPRQVVSKCNATMTHNGEVVNDVAELCENYTYPVYAGNVKYKNLFCALCNGITPEPTCKTSSTVVHDVIVLTNLLPTFTYEPEAIAANVCQASKYWYDPIKEVCRLTHCTQGRHKSGDFLCVIREKTNTLLDTYKLQVTFQPLATEGRSEILQNWNSTLTRERVAAYLANATFVLNARKSVVRIGVVEDDGDSPFLLADVQFVAGRNDNRSSFEIQALQVFTDQSLEIPAGDDNVRTLKFGVNVGENAFADNGTPPKTSGTLDLKSFSEENSLLGESPLTVNLTALTPYTFVLLNSTEYEILGDIVNFTYANASLKRWMVQFWRPHRNDGILVPVVYLMQAYQAAGLTTVQEMVKRLYEPGEAENALALCCFGVSILFLSFMLATYSTFPQMRTLPGIMNMFLAGWLLLGQVLLISVPFRTELRSLCSLLGVALHYAWLVVVLWTSACSFHMFHVFVTQQSSLHMPHRHAWYLKRYTLFAHGVPALIVITVVCASLLMSDGQEMGYGKDICYLDSVLLVGVGFVLPLALCVTFNLVQLALTAHALSPVQHVQAYGVETERSNIRIYIKLSSLTGMCWVVALLAEVPGCEWMRYVAVVLNGLQGPHLALSYTASSRVMRLWARLLNGQHSKRKRKFHTSSSSSKTNKSKVTTL
ncbi:hypothetical protein BaRGS_00033767, partial [Batillaria attramentaria]